MGASIAWDLSTLDAGIEFPEPIKLGGAVGRAPFAMIEEDPENPRFEHDALALDAFADDIRERGILQLTVVRRLESGMLRIRFGSRRLQALRLALPDGRFVVTADARQFDDCAQVAEDERRAALRPLELATFIAKKLAQAEKKKAVARPKIDASAVTHLLALVGAASPCVLEFCHTGKCRSLQYLYALRRPWEQNSRARCSSRADCKRAARG